MSLDFVAGCVGGAAGVLVGHPLDTVKVNIQTQCSVNPKYSGTLHCLKTLLVKEGVRGLYRGASSPVVGLAGVNAIVFGVYANVERNMPNPQSMSSQIFAGAVAGLITSFITSPMDLAKSRIQVAGPQAGKNPMDCLIRVYKKEKFKGLFQGFGFTVAREIPGFVTYFLTYELLVKQPEGKIASTGQILFAGGMAGVVSWLIPYPIDVIKSRIQVDGIVSREYTGYYDCANKIVQREGIKSLYRGMTPALIRAFPVNAVTFCVVTWTMRIADQGFGAFGISGDLFKKLDIGVQKAEPTLG